MLSTILSTLPFAGTALPLISVSSVIIVVIASVIFYAVLERLSVARTTQGLPGPRFVWPFFGTLMEMIFDPFPYWHAQDKYGPISWNKILNLVYFFCRDSNLSRQVFATAATKSQIVLNLNGERLLGSNNIAFMQGEVHKEVRKQLLPLFVRKALSTYITIQERKIREHISLWLKESNSVTEMRPLMRELNMATSQDVFLGTYLPESEVTKFRSDYNLVNQGMLCLPWNLPGTTLWYAIRARKRIVEQLTVVAHKCKENMSQGNPPTCLLDYWMQNTVVAIQEAHKNGTPEPLHSSDHEVGSIALDFLFASQDASTSSLTWASHYLSLFPDVLERIRNEQKIIRPNDESLTPENLSQMTYTKQVVKEVLRFRAPATMVPHKALADFELDFEGKKIQVRKGQLLMPSIFSSSFQGFEEPNKFDPERFNEVRQEDVKYSNNWLVFGAGPHRCLGYEYAIYHLTAFVALFSMHVQFERVITKNMEEIVYGPTIFPADGCLLNLHPRVYEQASPVQ